MIYINKNRNTIISFGLLALLFVIIAILEQVLPRTSMLFTVLKKGAIYALVAVSMNLRCFPCTGLPVL